MDVTISVAEVPAVEQELRSLFTWLSREEELRGRVRLVEPPPEPDTLGVLPQALMATLGQGGATVTVLVSAVIAWIRYRTSEVSCTLTRPDGTSVQVTAKRVHGTGLAGVGEFVQQVSAALDGDVDSGQ